MTHIHTFENYINEANISFYKSVVQQAIKDALGHDVKQADVKVGAKRQSGGYDMITLNGELLCSSSQYDEMLNRATNAIKEDPAKYGLKESVTNEAADLSPLDSLLTKNGWKETKNKSIAAGRGNVRHFDYENSANGDSMIRIVDSPLNGVYVEMYKDDSQVNPMDNKKFIQTADELIKGAKKYLNANLKA